MPPLGIMYLAAWLQKFGHEVQIIDLAGEADWRKKLYKEARKMDGAAFVGITCTTPQYHAAMKIRDRIRSLELDVPVTVGGIHLTSLVHANEMDFLNDGFDSYCIGEGYNAVTQMCDDVKRGTKLSKMYSAPILKDINELPFAARDLIDIHAYRYKLGDVPATTFYSQYGCPYACQYCESPMAGSFTVRAMTPQRIQDEIRDIRDTYGIRGVTFFDDEMNLFRQRMLGICEKLKELGDIVWRGFMVTAKFDGELARACKASGCYEVATGIESGSPRILKNIKKPATVEINARFIRTAKEAGLRVKAFMIVGLPGESWQTIRETDAFLESLRRDGIAPDDCDFSLLQVYPGAPVYQNPQDVVFRKDYEKAYYKSAPGAYEDLVQIKTAAMSATDLVAARNFLEDRWKPPGWVKQHGDRQDLDRIMESIEYARRKLRG